MKGYRSWLLSIMATLTLVGTAKATEDCSLEAGKEAFSACQTCHSVESNGTHLVGPNLRGVIGRGAGEAEGFYYSPAFEELSFEWTPERLNSFLEKPMSEVPGTFMAFGGIQNAQTRQDLICYLEQLQ
ncbi:c-type cytochrome [Vreelandella neptunia]|uniref:c-type cytochrome n=1 Tax=Vreelandella neptunia TaxID=115551 RepID=UPI00315B0AC6